MTNNEQRGTSVLVVGGDGGLVNCLLLCLALRGRRKVHCLVSSTIEAYRTDMKASLEEATEMLGVPSTLATRAMSTIVPIQWYHQKSSLGISKADIQLLREGNICQIWQCHEVERGLQPFRNELVNEYVSTTRHLMDLARCFGIQEYNFVDSSYGPWKLSESHCDEGWGNRCASSVDIDSKKAAEQIILRESMRGAFRCRVFRAPVIVGNSKTYSPYVESVLFDLIRCMSDFVQWVHDRVPGYYSHNPLRVERRLQAELRVAPIDTFVEEIVAISDLKIEEDCCWYESKTFSVTLHDIIAKVCEQMRGIKVEFVGDSNSLTRFDKLFDNKLLGYLRYFRGGLNSRKLATRKTCSFDANFVASELLEHVSRSLSAHEASSNAHEVYSSNVMETLGRVQFRDRRGRQRQYYGIGQGAAIVLLNTVGASHMVWKGIIPYLCRGYRVLTWRCRGLEQDGSSVECGSDIFGRDERVVDIEEVLDREQVDRVHLVGWCSGASDAVSFYYRVPRRVKSLTLLAGVYTDRKEYGTDHNQDLETMASVLRAAPHMAGMFVESLKQQMKARRVFQGTDSEIANAIGRVSPQHLSIVSEDLLREERLIRYCAMLLSGDLKVNIEGDEDINVPSLVVNGDIDSVAHPRQGDFISAKMPIGYHLCIPSATHWVPLENWRVTAKVIKHFIDGVEFSDTHQSHD